MHFGYAFGWTTKFVVCPVGYAWPHVLSNFRKEIFKENPPRERGFSDSSYSTWVVSGNLPDHFAKWFGGPNFEPPKFKVQSVCVNFYLSSSIDHFGVITATQNLPALSILAEKFCQRQSHEVTSPKNRMKVTQKSVNSIWNQFHDPVRSFVNEMKNWILHPSCKL